MKKLKKLFSKLLKFKKTPFAKEQNNDSTHLIEVKNLSVSFVRGNVIFNALRKVDFYLDKGEIVGVVGESGSGKTTLGKTIMGLYARNEGEIKLLGKTTPPTKLIRTSKSKKWIFENGQMIFQDPVSSIDSRKKVLEIVREGLVNFKIVKKQNIKSINLLKDEIKKLEETKKEKEYIHNNLKRISTKFDSNLEKFLSKDDQFDKYILLQKKLKNLIAQKASLTDKIFAFKREYKNSIKNMKSKKNFSKIQSFNNTKKDSKQLKMILLEEEFFIKKWLATNQTEIQNITFENLNSIQNKICLRNINILISKILKKYPITSDNEKYLAKLKIIKNLLKLKKTKEIPSMINSLVFDKTINLDEESDFLQGLKSIFLYQIPNFEIYKLFLNFGEYRLQKQVVYFEKQNIDMSIMINEIENSYSKFIFSEEVDIYEEYVSYYKHLKILLTDKIVFFKNIISEFSNLSVIHNESNYKDIYTFLFKKNKEVEKINLAIEVFRYKRETSIQKKLFLFREKTLNSKINKINFEISETKEILNSNKWINNIKAYKNKLLAESELKLKDQAKYLQNQEKINLKIDALKKELAEAKSKNTKKNIKNEEIELVKKTLSLVGISSDSLDSFPNAFSGGQKQRIGIARAIVNKPKFLIADEPISALDVSVQAQVINLIKQISSELGISFVFIAHDLEVVNYISDRVYVMYKGKVVEYGKTNLIYSNPIHPYTKALLAAIPKFNFNKTNKTQEKNIIYDDSVHFYNEFVNLSFIKIEQDHYVYGSKSEFKKWIPKEEKHLK